eukprot:CAMPEP_0169394502 /NCGR_PEP_ID=MMETSP1017-20121227/50063_1 /TAXON_ID=342587 /ORGANISM="Karlodinium micrum, Strain CCMP2283" /LENGTH=50 /DNA_ID=CAMNT_0009498267 /DNA_START=310 /DNA_END=462 /DNA_ORIENTATION=+
MRPGTTVQAKMRIAQHAILSKATCTGYSAKSLNDDIAAGQNALPVIAVYM